MGMDCAISRNDLRHVFSRAARQHEILSTTAIAYLLFLNIGAVIFHLFTTYVAYRFDGGFAASITFLTPPLSEVYWFISTWHSTGTFFNGYTQHILACAAVVIFGGAVVGVVGLLETVR